jgi:hypothetical protein
MTGIVTVIALIVDISPIWWCVAAGVVGYLI